MVVSMFRIGVVAGLAVGVVALPLACATGTPAEAPPLASQGGSGSTGNGNGGVGNFTSTDDDDAPSDDACATTSAELESQPMDVVMVLDRSKSMSGKWMDMVDSLAAFFNDDASSGLTVGINFFPHLQSADACDQSAYESLAVNMAELPSKAPTIVSALNSVTTDGATPTYGALAGTYDYAIKRKQANPETPLIVVFASDGDPCCGTCEIEEIGPISDLAAEAHDADVPTYVIAIEGSSVENLDEIALAGGTIASYDITADVGLFAVTLDEIRSALGCDYTLPEPEGSDVIDPGKVNVVFTPGGGMAETIPKEEAGKAACDDQPAWYYSDETTVSLCPKTCEMVRGDYYAKVDVQFGCETVLK